MSTSGRCKKRQTFAAALVAWLAAGAALFGAETRAVAVEDYAAVFGERYADAVRFVRQNPWIAAALQLPPQDARIAVAVAFPEIIRFSALEDDIQVRGLKVLYVQYGRSYANFSVGRFQMKPSFAEQIEEDAGQLFTERERHTAAVPSFESADTPEFRAQRVRRLDDLAWQVRYLRLFMLVMSRRYPGASAGGAEDRLRFYATAYNAGYRSGEAELRRRGLQRRFHLALVLPSATYNYADVALFFYRSQAGWSAGPRFPEAP